MGDGILIVCGQRSFSEQLQKIISASVPGSHSIVTSGAEARRLTGVTEFDAILIAGRLPDEDCLTLAAELSGSGVTGVMVVVERNALYDAHDVLDGTGVTILAWPLTKESLTQAIRLIVKVREGGGTLENAKLMLMQRKGWTEPQAHRYIQKVSMDKRLPRDITAQMIIKALEKEAKSKS